jgi:hypothetical protein
MIVLDKDGNVLAESANGYEWTARTEASVITDGPLPPNVMRYEAWPPRASHFGTFEIATVVFTPDEAEIMSWIMDRWHSGESTD